MRLAFSIIDSLPGKRYFTGMLFANPTPYYGKSGRCLQVAESVGYYNQLDNYSFLKSLFRNAFLHLLYRCNNNSIGHMAKQQTRKARQGSPFVYQLIERMSSDEKRYFKIFAQKYEKGDANLCLLLFSAINTELRKGNTLTDEVVRSHVKGLAMESYFVSAKNKLKNMLCDALHDMHSRHTEEYAIMKGIGVAGILHEKGFAAESRKQLTQAMQNAQQKEYYSFWLEGFRHKVNHSIADPAVGQQQLHDWKKEMTKVVAQLEDHSRNILNNRLCFKAYITGNDKIDEQTSKVFNEKNLQHDVLHAKSMYAKYLSLNGLLFYYDKHAQRKELSKIALQQKNILQDTLVYTHRYAGEFFVAYQNYLNSLDPVKQAELIVKGSREMEEEAQKFLIKGRSKKIGLLAINNATMVRLNVFIEQNNLPALDKEVHHAIALNKQIKSSLGVANEVVLLSLIKDSFFIAGKYNEATKWIKQLKALIPAGILNHYKLCNLFTELMILIDTGAPVRALRNSEENLRLAIARFNYTPEQQQTILKLLKHISIVATARNAKELHQYLNGIIAFAVEIKRNNDGILKNLVSESNAKLWAGRKLKA